MNEVACLGILVADVVTKPFKKMPERGRLDLIDRMELHTGGCAVNTGRALAKLGVKTAVLGKVGEDGFGDFIIKTLRESGIDTKGIRRDSKVNTSGTVVLVYPDGERSFIHYLGANAAYTIDDVDWDVIGDSKLLHIGGALVLPGIDGEPTTAILKKVREMGKVTSLDTVWDAKGRWMSLIKPNLPYIDYFLPSLEEAKMLTGKNKPEDIARMFLDMGVKTVGLKMGEEGCYIRSQDEEYHIPIYKVEVVDATGAGDAYVAGFLLGVLKGWELEKIGRMANAVGACCVTAIGASAGVKSYEETVRMIS